MKNILIIEDEKPAYRKLLRCLEALVPEFDHTWARSIHEAKAALAGPEAFSLLIADIQLREQNIFSWLLEVLPATPIIFCTAYSEYLNEAFQTSGIAYVLKPYDQETLGKALEKYQRLFVGPSTGETSQQLVKLLRESMREVREYKNRLVCKSAGNEMQVVEVADISLIEAQGNFCKLHTRQGKRFLVSESLGMLEKKLNPAHFFRINRSQLLQVQALEKMEPYFKNRLLITLTGLAEKVKTSSAKTAAFRVWLEG